MCFYVKRHLDYRTLSQPSYKLARETEAVKEKEKEREKEAEMLASLREEWRSLDDLDDLEPTFDADEVINGRQEIPLSHVGGELKFLQNKKGQKR